MGKEIKVTNEDLIAYDKERLAPLEKLAKIFGPMAAKGPKWVPPKLNDVILRALEKDRDKRWPDALSFLHALVRVADALRQVSTQEIPAIPPGKPASLVAALATPRPGGQSGSGEMSKEEKETLLPDPRLQVEPHRGSTRSSEALFPS